jgi:hypothetical protein
MALQLELIAAEKKRMEEEIKIERKRAEEEEERRLKREAHNQQLRAEHQQRLEEMRAMQEAWERSRQELEMQKRELARVQEMQRELAEAERMKEGLRKKLEADEALKRQLRLDLSNIPVPETSRRDWDAMLEVKHLVHKNDWRIGQVDQRIENHEREIALLKELIRRKAQSYNGAQLKNMQASVHQEEQELRKAHIEREKLEQLKAAQEEQIRNLMSKMEKKDRGMKALQGKIKEKDHQWHMINEDLKKFRNESERLRDRERAIAKELEEKRLELEKQKRTTETLKSFNAQGRANQAVPVPATSQDGNPSRPSSAPMAGRMRGEEERRMTGAEGSVTKDSSVGNGESSSGKLQQKGPNRAAEAFKKLEDTWRRVETEDFMKGARAVVAANKMKNEKQPKPLDPHSESMVQHERKNFPAQADDTARNEKSMERNAAGRGTKDVGNNIERRKEETPSSSSNGPQREPIPVLVGDHSNSDHVSPGQVEVRFLEPKAPKTKNNSVWAAMYRLPESQAEPSSEVMKPNTNAPRERIELDLAQARRRKYSPKTILEMKKKMDEDEREKAWLDVSKTSVGEEQAVEASADKPTKQHEHSRKILTERWATAIHSLGLPSSSRNNRMERAKQRTPTVASEKSVSGTVARFEF